MTTGEKKNEMFGRPTHTALAAMYDEQMAKFDQIKTVRQLLEAAELQPVFGNVYDKIKDQFWYLSGAFFDFVAGTDLGDCAIKLVAGGILGTDEDYLRFRAATCAILVAIAVDESVKESLDADLEQMRPLFAGIRSPTTHINLSHLRSENVEEMKRLGRSVTAKICALESFARIKARICGGSNADAATDAVAVSDLPFAKRLDLAFGRVENVLSQVQLLISQAEQLDHQATAFEASSLLSDQAILLRAAAASNLSDQAILLRAAAASNRKAADLLIASVAADQALVQSAKNDQPAAYAVCARASSSDSAGSDGAGGADETKSDSDENGQTDDQNVSKKRKKMSKTSMRRFEANHNL
jgi:hypothetical protein